MTSTATIEELIERKRDGYAHTAAELDRIIHGYTNDEIPDYQMAAWLMAALLNGLDPDETAWMTDAMVRSGRQVDLSSIPGVKVDKHSTGGVADTTTLVLCPLVAACGVPVAKMSGRGLGFTGGTLDKLESIPGYSIELTPDQFVSQVRDIGIAVIAQSPDVDPADKKIYALRDVTATVPSIPLIVGSIISKKVAGGADAVLLDVKVGSGAFMKTERDARALASELTRVGAVLGRKVTCVMTDMSQPLGMAVGNVLEVREAIETLRGHGPAALTELCVVLGGKMLTMARVCESEDAARQRCARALADGSALERFRRWIAAQGGDSRIADDPELLPLSACVREVRADGEGFVMGCDAEGIGRVAMLLGAGRASKDDPIDFGAGLQLAVRTGDAVSRGDLMCTMYARSAELLDEGERRFRDSVVLRDVRVDPPPLFHEL